MYFKGSNQSSEFNFYGGAFLQVYTAFRFDNFQSLNTATHGTTFDGIRGDMIIYEDGGGGGLKMYGGFVSLQNLACSDSACVGALNPCPCCTGSGTGDCPYNASDTRWVIRSTDNATENPNTAPTLLAGLHYELHGNTGLANISGSPDPEVGSNIQLHVLGGAIVLPGDIAEDKDLVRIGSYTFVHLDGVHMFQGDFDDDDGDGFFESWKAHFTADTPLVRNGVLLIENSELYLLPCSGGGCSAPPYPYRIPLLDNATWAHANEYGLLVARNNRGPAAGPLGIATGESIAFDVTRGTPGTWEVGIGGPIRLNWLGPVDDWPRDTSGTDRELTLWVPKGFKLTGVRGFQDAATNCTDGAVGRYHVGLNDKSEKLASTWRTFASEQQQLNTTLYRVLDTDNERRLRFWADHANAATQFCKGDYVTIEGK